MRYFENIDLNNATAHKISQHSFLSPRRDPYTNSLGNVDTDSGHRHNLGNPGRNGSKFYTYCWDFFPKKNDLMKIKCTEHKT